MPYHMIDVAPAGYKYNLYEYLRDANAAIDDIRSRNRLPVIVGGTGMYVEALLNGLVLRKCHVMKHCERSLPTNRSKSLPTYWLQ